MTSGLPLAGGANPRRYVSVTPIARDPDSSTITGEMLHPVGVVLAGGQSRRMGRDKTALSLSILGDETLLSWAAHRMAAVCDTWVVADNGRALMPGAISVVDGPGAGPAAGILGVAQRFPERALFVLACDLPLIPARTLMWIAALAGDWVLPFSDHGAEPLCALYRPQALDALRRQVAIGSYSLRALHETASDLSVRRISPAELMAASGSVDVDPELLFLNVNHPRDVESIDALASRSDVLSRFLRLDSTKR